MGLTLQIVRERAQLARPHVQRDGYQPVREPRVLGQQRPVQIGADRAALPRPLLTRAPIVAVTSDHAPKRAGLRAEMGAPAVVLEAGQDSRRGLGLERDL